MIVVVDVDVDFLVGLVDLRAFFPGLPPPSRGSASTVTRILHGDSPPAPFGVSKMRDFEGLFRGNFLLLTRRGVDLRADRLAPPRGEEGRTMGSGEVSRLLLPLLEYDIFPIIYSWVVGDGGRGKISRLVCDHQDTRYKMEYFVANDQRPGLVRVTKHINFQNARRVPL